MDGDAGSGNNLALPRVVALSLYTASNVALYGLLKKHHVALCTGTWWSALLMEPSPYCQLVAYGLAALQFAPLIAVGVAVGPMAGRPLW